jgi:hypothetical protein
VRSAPIVLNDLLLLACVSMYLGTGWSLVLFSFPIRPRLTVDTYYDQFVPQVTLATRFFTWMTTVMIAAASSCSRPSGTTAGGRPRSCSPGSWWRRV